MGSADLEVLRLWLWTRVSVLLLVGAGAWLVGADATAKDPVPYLERWNVWDTPHYVAIAQWGYDGDPANPSSVPLDGLFPGLPLAMRTLHGLLGLNFVTAGLLISFMCGGVAVVALSRVAALETLPGLSAQQMSERTVLLFLISPPAIFLAAAYTEALFLALALPAWLAARRGSWVTAGLLAAGASTVRVEGLFLALALVVEFLTVKDGRRERRSAPALVLPFLPLVAFSTYLHGRTGDWFRWQHAREQGWGHERAWPWEGLSTAFHGRFDGELRTDFAWMYVVDVVALIVGLALTGWLLRRRRWAEAVYVGLSVLTLACDTFWQSTARYALLWWPLWVVLATASLRRPVVHRALLILFAPLMVTFAVTFTTYRWVG